MSKKTFTMYEGMGFVEVLIAIMVTGVASVVLMSISANSIRSMLTTETIDAMTQYARNGSVIAQQIADVDPEVFTDDSTHMREGHCYPFEYDGGTDTYSIDTSIDTHWVYGDREDYKDGVLVDPANEDAQDLYFRVICLDEVIEFPATSVTQRAVVKIVVGGLVYEGEITNDRDIKDYEYISVIDL